MATQDDIRSDLDDEVFSIIGKSATLISKSAPQYNSRGEVESVTNTYTTVTIVPYTITQDRQTFEEIGNINEGEMFAAVRYNQTVNIDDQIIISGLTTDTWSVKTVEPNYLPDNVVTIIRIAKDQD